MVHLGKVPTVKEIQDEKSDLPQLDKLALGYGEDEFSSNVYGSKFAALDLPKHSMPEDEMPREIAYRMIKYVETGTNSFMEK